MTVNDRLSKIANKRAELDRQADEEQRQREVTIAKYKDEFKALAPRLEQLMAIAIELRRNKLPLGKQTRSILGTYEDEFVAEGVHHKLGFYRQFTKDGVYLVGIGIEGGGCCGDDLAVSSTGTIIANPLDHVIGCWTYDNAYYDFVGKCKKFLDGFDDFERRVNEYVDNL